MFIYRALCTGLVLPQALTCGCLPRVRRTLEPSRRNPAKMPRFETGQASPAAASPVTATSMLPMRSIDAVILSPGRTAATPSGVPV